MSEPVDCRALFPTGDDAEAWRLASLNPMSSGLKGSSILKIAYEIRAMQDAGNSVCNLTVGDFSPAQFSVPVELREGVDAAFAEGQTNYPPSFGTPELRAAVVSMYERDLGLTYGVDSVIVGSGARPPIYATFSLVVQAGDKVMFCAPSWNNPHYVHINGAEAVKVHCGPETDFLPTRELLEGKLDGVSLICLNSPLNPTGTVFDADQLGGICDLVLEENARREARGDRPLMVMYDQVYWMLTYGDAKHVTPPGLRPEMAKYTIFVDAISKSFAATGLRVGWAVIPEPFALPFRALMGHIGAWAPKPEQLATAKLLNDPEAITRYHGTMKQGLEDRLRALHDGLQAMKAKGLPADSIAPQGAIYLTGRFDIAGRNWNGKVIATDEDVRSFLLEEAGFGIVPLAVFGPKDVVGWVRLSVGAVGLDDIAEGLARIEAALEKLD
ncbi:MAG: aminotransferase class I/II-fold pyridoxal phosphate-dependent enzyme [Deltaproteobacteria bacterium]|nr:aminotransferase class I/II-fold pyridoxal phosphate-dependent enzyme [Deltaproteobacteria bacterium]